MLVVRWWHSFGILLGVDVLVLWLIGATIRIGLQLYVLALG
jgi:hypothetical protein